jgi:K+-sensing histidine kinase KdpD
MTRSAKPRKNPRRPSRPVPRDSVFYAPALGRDMKKEFYSSLSHIFRGPLVGATGYVDYLFKGYAGHLTPDQLRQLARVRESIQRLASVTDAFLDLTAFDLDLIQPANSPTDLCATIKNMLGSLREFGHSRTVSMVVCTPDTPVNILMDRHWVKTLLNELTSNAMLLTRDGGRVQLDIVPQNRKVLLRLSCTSSYLEGKGKPEFFRPFFRLPEKIYPQGGRRGGLGLSLVKRIVAVHGGKIQVGRYMRNGFTVTVTLKTSGVQS